MKVKVAIEALFHTASPLLAGQKVKVKVASESLLNRVGMWESEVPINF